MKTLILFTFLLSTYAHAGRYDHLLSGNASMEELCQALARSMSESRGHVVPTAQSLDVVMDYFIAGIYLNARWIEKAGLGKHIEPFIIERAHKELSDAKFAQTSAILDEAIERSQPTTTTTIVWRGQAPNVPPPRNGKMYEVNEPIVIPQYLSSTNTQSLAESYAKGVLMRIEVPPGARALNVQRFLSLDDRQHESLFGRNRTVIADKIEIRGKQTYIEGHLLLNRGEQ